MSYHTVQIRSLGLYRMASYKSTSTPSSVVRIAPDDISFARADTWNDVDLNAPGRSALPKSKPRNDAISGRLQPVLNA
jgi:hypothetical protein